MSDEAITWFYHEVVASYDAYTNARDKCVAGRFQHRRAAISAATALFHFREHLPPKLAMSRKEVENTCPQYALLGDVVNASKHKTLTQGKPI